MVVRSTLCALCIVLGIGVPSGWPQIKKQPKTPVPYVLNDPPDANPQYFPKGVFGDSESGTTKDFTARWYSISLRAMHEPSLFEDSKDRSLVAYRFLWLRSFHDPIAIRMSIRSDGTASLTGKVIAAPGGGEPGVMTRNQTFEISKAQVQVFLTLAKKTAFWTSATGGFGGGNDGAQWIMEGLQKGVYHVVDRWSPQKDDYANMCLYLVNLSKIQLQANEIY